MKHLRFTIYLALLLLPGIARAGTWMDGTASIVKVPNNANLTISTAVTVSVWVKLYRTNFATGIAPIICKGRDVVNGACNYCFRFNYGSINTAEFIFASPNSSFIQARSISHMYDVTNTWIHFAMRHTFASAANSRFYSNGVPSGMQFYAGASNATATVNSEAMNIGRDDSTSFFPGEIAELAIWNVALTDNEIYRLSGGGSGRPAISRLPLQIRAASLVGYWPLSANFDITLSGTNTLKDLSNSHADATPLSSPKGKGGFPMP